MRPSTDWSFKKDYVSTLTGYIEIAKERGNLLTEKEIIHLLKKLLRTKKEMIDLLEANQLEPLGDDGKFTIHNGQDADLAEREKQITIIYSAQNILNQVNEALDRIRDGTYGKCVDTGKDIPYGRLEIPPYAKRTVEAQKRYDEGVTSIQN